MFSRLLDADAGYFNVRPAGEAAVTRRYLDATMVLQTSFTTPSGTLVLTDALATGDAGDPHRLGATAPGLLVRAVECTTGEVSVEVHFAPRPEYGLVAPLLTAVDGGVLVRGGADVLILSCSAPLQIAEGAATGKFPLQAGQRVVLGVQHRSTSEPFPAPLSATELDAALRQTITAWQDWSAAHQGYQGPRQELVHHSGRVLQGAFLPAHRGDCRRAHDIAARSSGRTAQLGLPLHLGTGCQLHLGGAVGGGLPG